MTRETDAVRHVLFVCPHGAAKSVLAGSWFNRLAAERGMDVRAIARGTEPDTEVSGGIRRDVGDALCTDRPTRLTAEDVAAADLLVAFDLSELELGAAPDRAWNALPALSEDFDAGRSAIMQRVVALLDQLQSQAGGGGAPGAQRQGAARGR